VQVVKYEVENHEGWTPVVKGKEEKRPLDKGDGIKLNPARIDKKSLRKMLHKHS